MLDSVRPDFANSPASSLRPVYGYAPADVSASPAVTIVTPFRNTGAIFHETARSVLRQSLQQWEWLIVNDGSTDADALSILDRYRHVDERIRVIDLAQSRGPGAARNVGYEEANAPFVLQLDSDNLVEPTAAEKWLWYLATHEDAAFVKGWSVGFGAEEYLWKHGFHDGRAFLDRNMVDATALVRKSAHRRSGGYDASIRDGLEDWDFWLRCASAGLWGATVPEFLDWYRRRASHADRWKDWDNGDRQASFRGRLMERYPALWNGRFPRLPDRHDLPNETVPHDLPLENRLEKHRPRVLLVVPWLTWGGSDTWNLSVVEALTRAGWDVSIATTLPDDDVRASSFGLHTPDIFFLPRFLRVADQPRFLRYLIQSRSIDVVLITHSELGYMLLPYLRAHCRGTAFVDYCHMEEKAWRNGGYPRLSVEYQGQLDMSIVSSEHLRDWMVHRGAARENIEVGYTNVDVEAYRPEPAARAVVRTQLRLGASVPTLLYPARLCAQKQPRVFAGTIQVLVRRGVDFAAIVAGDGPDMAWLRDFLQRNNLDRHVRVAGAVSAERMAQLYCASDVLFLPSAWEGISISIYEAMASGLAIVAAAVGGQHELVTAECGVLLPHSDEQMEVAAYADTLAALLAAPGRVRSMGDAGRRRVVEHFAIERMHERMLALLTTARQRHGTDPRPVPPESLAAAWAAQAVECVRLQRLSDQLWAERRHDSLAVRAYQAFSRRFQPLYERGVEQGWDWLPRLRTRVKLSLLGRA